MAEFPSYKETVVLPSDQDDHHCVPESLSFPRQYVPGSKFRFTDEPTGTLWRCSCRKWWVVSLSGSTRWWTPVRPLTRAWFRVRKWERSMR